MSLRPLRALGLVCLGLTAALLLFEAGLRIRNPDQVLAFASNRYIAAEGGVDGRLAFTVDDELGYRPVLGGPDYGPNGATHNDYAFEKPAGVRRLLFLGDSVTHRGRIQAGFQALLGDQGYEYWNAGVEGYSTVQEVAYYRRFCATLRADHVLLTFHLNDFQSTPVVFRDGEQLVRLYSKDSTRTLSPWLLQHSHLYRWYLSLGLGEHRQEPRGVPPASEQIEQALRELESEVTRQGATLTVLVLPWLRPLEKWPGSLMPKRNWILATLTRLGIAHHDFVATLEGALAEGMQVTEEQRDPQHPSSEFGRRMARDLLAAGFQP